MEKLKFFKKDLKENTVFLKICTITGLLYEIALYLYNLVGWVSPQIPHIKKLINYKTEIKLTDKNINLFVTYASEEQITFMLQSPRDKNSPQYFSAKDL